MEEYETMELNQDLRSSMNVKPEAGSLKVKLKIPKEEMFLHHEMMMNKNNTTQRACKICDKVFSSGKALGGHMRIHYVYDKDLLAKKLSKSKGISTSELVDDDAVDQDQYVLSMKKPICSICGRDFPSMKSLSGHLRCHPDRAWRGIQPPDQESGKEHYVSSSYSFSPSSSLSDAELTWSNGDYFVDGDELGEQRVVDLAQSLSSGWVVTARRGRKATGVGSTSEACSNSVEDELLLKAANDLMVLSSGLMSIEEAPKKAKSLRKVRVGQVSKSKGKRKISEVQIYEEKGSNEVEKTFKKLVCYSSDDDDNVLVSKISGKHEVVEDAKPQAMMIMKNKKRSKKKVMKLCDLDQNGVTPLIKHKAASAVTCDKYRCDTCDKSFPTHQALGGHMSSHNKHKLYILNSMDMKVVDTEGSSSQVISPGEASETHKRVVLDFDLNEKLPSDEDEGVFISEVNYGNNYPF